MVSPRRAASPWPWLALAATLQAAVMIDLLLHSGFLVDDFVHLWVSNVEHGRRLTWRYLVREDFGHLAIWQRFIFHFVFSSANASWTAAGIVIVSGNLLATYAAFRAASVLVGKNAWAVGSAAVLGLSPLWANSFWLGCAADTVVPLPATMLAFELAARRIRSGSRACSAGAALAMGLTLLGRERGAILPASFALLALALTPERLSPRLAWQRLVQLWDLWLACAAVLVSFAIPFLRGGYLLDQLYRSDLAAPSVMAVGSGVANVLARMLIPGLMGVLPFTWDNPAVTALANTLALASFALLVAAVPRSPRAIVFLFASMVLSILPVALGRGSLVEVIAVETRYGVETLPFVAMFVALIGFEIAAGRARNPLGAAVESRWRAAAWLLGAAWIGASFVSMERYQQRWFGGLASFAQRYRRAIESLPSGRGETVLDSVYPRRLLILNQEPAVWATASTMLERRKGGLCCSDRTAAHIHRFDEAAVAQRWERRESFTMAAPPCSDPGRLTVPIPATLRSAPAILVEPEWIKPAPEWIVPLAEAATLQRGVPIPVAMSRHPTSAFIPLVPGATAVGFEGIGRWPACASSLRMTALARAPSP